MENKVELEDLNERMPLLLTLAESNAPIRDRTIEVVPKLLMWIPDLKQKKDGVT